MWRMKLRPSCTLTSGVAARGLWSTTHEPRLANYRICSEFRPPPCWARSPDGRAGGNLLHHGHKLSSPCHLSSPVYCACTQRAVQSSLATDPSSWLLQGCDKIQPCLCRILRQHSLPGPSRKLLRPPFSNRFHQVATCATVFLIFPQHSGAMAARRASGVVAASAMRRGACGAVARAAVPRAAGSGRACSTVAAFPLDKELPG